mmetsp:Transcript_27919/g.55977  ORF Transcript_27919/g.55977 Transcript_27919/m.55977 type:complete len:159 (-) Transcript_27919:20-496(-)|eukprot:scaffold43634_cov226-Skeletonema_marinoi.AAC.2
MDKKQNSQLNLRAMRQYLGDKYRETHDDWINSWTLTDDSASFPTQTKGYDCRIFLMANALCLHNRSSCLPLRTRESIFTEGRNRITWLLAGKHQQALPAAQSLTTRPSKRTTPDARQLKMGQVEAIAVNYEAGQNIQEPQAVVASPDLERDTEEDLQE